MKQRLVEVRILVHVLSEPETEGEDLMMDTEMELAVFPGMPDIPNEIVHGAAIGGIKAALVTLQEEWGKHHEGEVKMANLQPVRQGGAISKEEWKKMHPESPDD